MTQEAKATKGVELVWKCQVEGCTFSAPPTYEGYNKLTGHQLHHARQGVPKGKRGIRLVDKNSGAVFARTLNEARDKGFLEPTPAPGAIVGVPLPSEAAKEPPGEPLTKVEPGAKVEAKVESPEEKPEKAKEGELTEPQVSGEGIFRYTITLPADAFTLFNMAKAAGKEKDVDKSFDVWVWDCIRKRFEKDYKLQVVLAGIEEE